MIETLTVPELNEAGGASAKRLPRGLTTQDVERADLVRCIQTAKTLIFAKPDGVTLREIR